ncbi:membrane-associated protein, putative, partial [Bodo saltans]
YFRAFGRKGNMTTMPLSITSIWFAATLLACVIEVSHCLVSTPTTSSDFFIVMNSTLAAGGGVAVNCRRECEKPANDKRLLVGGFMAWITSAAENGAVANLIGSTSFTGFLALGGSRNPSNTTWYWTEYPAQVLGRSPRGIPFYEGVTMSQGGRALGYANFLNLEPNNAPNSMTPGQETQVCFQFSQQLGWNDASVFDIGITGCVCRRFRTLSYSITAGTSSTVSLSMTSSNSMASSPTSTQSQSAMLHSVEHTATLTATGNNDLSSSAENSRSESIFFSSTTSSTVSESGATDTPNFSNSLRSISLSSGRSESLSLSPSRTASLQLNTISIASTLTVTNTRWSCGVAVSVSEISTALAPLSSSTTGVASVLTSTSVIAVAQVALSTTPRAVFATSPLSRSRALVCVPLAFNLTIVGPRSAVWWRVASVTTVDGQNLNFSTSEINFLNWWELIVECPRDGWWVSPATPQHIDTVINLQITMSCDEVAPMFIAVLAIPSPGVPPELNAQVKTAGQYAQVGSAVASSVAGFAVGRMMAIRGLAFCNADSAISGGLIDFDFEVCGDQQLDLHNAGTSVARSAVLSNIVVLGISAVVCGFTLAVISHFNSNRWTDAAAMLCLPSSLLPIWVAAVPSTSSAATFLLGRLESSACSTVDVVLGLVGIVLSLIPFAGILVLWNARARGEAAVWQCAHSLLELFASPTRSLWSWFQWFLTRCFARTWKWEGTPATSLNLKHLQQQHAWLLLLEYRFVWYAAIDTLTLAVLACVGIVSGLSPRNTAVCEIFTVVAAVILMLQLTIVLVFRPFTTVFGHCYTVAVLLLTTLSVVAQLVLLFASSGLDSWLLQGSAVCNLATVGVGLTKSLLDLVQLYRGVARRMRSAFTSLRCTEDVEPPLEAPMSVESPLQEEEDAVECYSERPYDLFDLDVDESQWEFVGTDLVDASESELLTIGTARAGVASDLFSMFATSSDLLASEMTTVTSIDCEP